MGNPKFFVIDNDQRSAEIDAVMEKINQAFLDYKITNTEAIWILEHCKLQILQDDLNG